MYARVSTLSIPPDRATVARRHVAEQAAPAAQGLPGVARAFWLLDAASGRLIAVTVYRTESDLADNRAGASEIRRKAAEIAGGTVRSVEEYEVIAEI